ncbi:MAG TPA: cation:proton antiporter, partial [Anditalea sp.]|nr:cation:proton antiporter [Anditalea sp.]
AILIFQDVVIVPLMLFTPMLAGESENIALSLLYMALKGLVVIGITIISAKYLMPNLLFRVAKTRNAELFLLCIIVTCFAVAYLTSLLGLSLGLGAFLAGLIISESEYSHHATGKIVPFREIFLSFFFVSVGMLFDVTFLYNHFFIIIGLVLLTFFVKFIIATIAVKAIGSTLEEAFIVGFSLFQVGEFSLLLAKEGYRYQLLDDITYQYFLAISIITMAVTPFILNAREKLAYRILDMPLPKTIKDKIELDRQKVEPGLEVDNELRDHLVIIGYGLNGKNLSRAAKRANIPYAIIEMNPETVRTEKAKGEPIIYGDAANESVLEHVNVHKARVIVIAISDSEATKGILTNIRHFTQNAFVIVRTRYVNEIDANVKLGADEVIPEEFETSIEIFTRVLDKYLVPRDEIEEFTEDVRSRNYEMFRSTTTVNNKERIKLDLPDINFVTLRIDKDSEYVGVKLIDMNIRENAGINIVAIRRKGRTFTDISGDTKLRLGDLIYVVGKPASLQEFEQKVTLY